MAREKRKRPAPRKRRARGTGALFWSAARKVWVGRVRVGTRDGKPLYAERSHPNQAEVVRLLALCRPPGPGTTVGEFAARWVAELDGRRNTVATRTNTIEKYVVPTLGATRLADLTPHAVERAAAAWLAAGREPSTVRLMLSHLQTCLRAAVRRGLLAADPVALAKKPKVDRKPVALFTPAELARIVAAASERPSTRLMALVAATGLRSGEALALDVGDFDAARGTVRVTKTYGQRGGMGPPKSPHSVRTVRVPAPALAACVAAKGSRTSGPLFCSRFGRRYVLPNVRLPWDRLLKRMGLAPRNPHVLRRSVATALNAAGVPVADAARYIGDTVAVYVKNYLHPTGADVCGALENVLKTDG